MEKTTVYLSAEQKAALATTARVEGRSEATLIRAGIDIVTARHRTGEVPAPYASTEDDQTEEVSVPRRPRWISREVFIREFLNHQADAGLRVDLRELAGGTTDDEPIP